MPGLPTALAIPWLKVSFTFHILWNYLICSSIMSFKLQSVSVPGGLIRTFDTPTARFCEEEVVQLCRCLILL